MLSPWVLGFTRGGAETWLPVIVGLLTIAYSLLTDYELGASPVLSMKTHLIFDIVGGILLISSPWLFGFAEYIWVPHVIFGMIAIGVALCTKPVPAKVERAHGRASESNRAAAAH
jgi:hypothetical protein